MVVGTSFRPGAVAPVDLAGTTVPRYIPRPLTMRVILQSFVPVDSGVLLY